MMEEMLKRRHLAATYGMRTPVKPAKQDKLVIDPIPEILHTGHVHICGMTRYRGVLGINAGAWQAQTKFQKQMNIQPTPARAAIVDLQTLEAQFLDFNEPGAPRTV
jgi:DNA polymerase II small subunit